MGFFDFLKKKKPDDSLKKGMEKTSGKIRNGFLSMLVGRSIDSEFIDDLEEILIAADIGPAVTTDIIESVRQEASRGDLKDYSKLILAIKAKIKEMMTSVTDAEPEREYADGEPYVILVSGVNGVGKTTSIAKLTNLYKSLGKSVLLAAGDTFRAAAAEQLTIWADRLEIPIVKHKDGSDPASVVFDAINSARSKKIDIVIADTAGRLHTKSNLMQELIKIERVTQKGSSNICCEKLLVLDATSGQNTINQAKTFKEAIGIDGIILTKLDGTAKGGVAIRIVNELKIPIKYVCFGENIEDISQFDVNSFVDALFD